MLMIIINDVTFIKPWGNEVAIRYKVLYRKSPKENDVFITTEMRLDSAPRTDIFDF